MVAVVRPANEFTSPLRVGEDVEHIQNVSSTKRRWGLGRSRKARVGSAVPVAEAAKGPAAVVKAQVEGGKEGLNGPVGRLKVRLPRRRLRWWAAGDSPGRDPHPPSRVRVTPLARLRALRREHLGVTASEPVGPLRGEADGRRWFLYAQGKGRITDCLGDGIGRPQ